MKTSLVRAAQRIVLPCLGLLLLFPAAAAQKSPQAEIHGRWTPGVYHIGNLVPLEIPVPVQSSDFYLEGKVTEGAEWGEGRIARLLQVHPTAYPGTLTLKIEVQIFDTGAVQLPPTELQVHTATGVHAFTVLVPPVKITPLLPPGDQPQPAPAELISVPFPFPWLYVAAALAALLLVCLCLFTLIRRARRRRGQVKEKPGLRELDPDLWIRREVERLFRTELDPPRRYEALSTNVRTYLEIKFQRPFLEWTSAEIQEGCSVIQRLSGAPAGDLMSVFRLCDAVLFARYAPTRDDERRAMEAIVRVIETVSAPTPLEEAS